MDGHTVPATAQAPALIIYLLDVSASMAQPMGGGRRIDALMGALAGAVKQMAQRSIRGARLLPLYRIAMIAYSDKTYDLLDGVRGIDQVARLGVPELRPQRTTDTAVAFETVERLLEAELPRLQSAPAPVVCHLTDGEHTGADPVPAARRIMHMAVTDGPVLVQHMLFSGAPCTGDIRSWPGILPDTPLADEYAQALREVSSPVPESYRRAAHAAGFALGPGALMFFPGEHPEMLRLGFHMSAAAPAE